MHLKTVELSVFRSFPSALFRFDRHLSCVVGKNGSGKTTLFEGIAAVLGSVIGSYGVEANPRPLGTDDRVLGDDSRPVDSPRVTATLIDSRGLGRKVVAETNPERTRARPATNGRALPVFAYFRSGRIWGDESFGEALAGDGRLRAYLLCLSHGSRLAAIAAQLGTAVDRRARDFQLAMVQDSVAGCFRSQGAYSAFVSGGEFFLTVPGRRTAVPLRLCADGVRSVATIAIELAWRAAVLNPHLGAKATHSSSGIVLVDEVDVHLHPEWQRALLHDLRRSFPKMQWVVSTHSPFVVHELQPGQLLNLGGLNSDPSGSIEDIVEYVFGVEVPARSIRRRLLLEAAQKFYASIDARSVTSLDRESRLAGTEFANELGPYLTDAAALALLRLEMLAAKSGK